MDYTIVHMFVVGKNFFCILFIYLFFKQVSYAYQGCINLIKNTV